MPARSAVAKDVPDEASIQKAPFMTAAVHTPSAGAATTTSSEPALPDQGASLYVEPATAIAVGHFAGYLVLLIWLPAATTTMTPALVAFSTDVHRSEVAGQPPSDIET